MKYIVGDVVSGYDSEKSYNFDILNPMIMVGSPYPLTKDEFENIKIHYIEKLNMIKDIHYSDTNCQIIGYIYQDESDYPLLCIDKRVVDSSRDIASGHSDILIHSHNDNHHKPFLTCYKSEKTYLVELSFLENDGYFIISLIDLYVLYLEELTKNFLSGEVVELLVSQLTEDQKHLALIKYYKEFC